MRLGLRGRILMLVLVALVPPTAVAVIVALEERSDARSHAQTDLLDITRLAAADAQAEVDATARFLSAVAEDLAARPGGQALRAAARAGAALYRPVQLGGSGEPQRTGLLRNDHARLGAADRTGGRVEDRVVSPRRRLSRPSSSEIWALDPSHA